MNTAFQDQQRHNMWCSLIDDYKNLTANGKKHMKVNFASANGCMPHEITLDTLPCAKQCHALTANPYFQSICKEFLPKNETTRNDNMYVSQDVIVREKTEESARREYFLSRVNNVHTEKSLEARLHFGLDAPNGPESARELVEWIKAGKFSFCKTEDDEDFDDYDERYNPLDFIRWTKKKADHKGYEAATDKLQKLVQQTKDAIYAETDFAKMPSILESFEKVSIH